MDFIDLEKNFKNNNLISRKNIGLFEPDFDDTQLYRWQQKGYIKKITRGYYIFSDLRVNDLIKYQISNTIYQPSYISLELALNIYGLIPEVVYAPTAVTSRKTYQISTPVGMFYYRHVKPQLMFGYTVERLDDTMYKIATIEKAFLDYLYLNPYIDSIKVANGLRIDLEYFLEQFNQEKFRDFLERFSCKALDKRVKNLIGEQYA